jgi:NADH-quinone oxidoreductase subunit J
MTTRPRLHTETSKAAGIIAVALFGFLAAVFLTAGFGSPAGFGDGSVTRSLAYTMFDLPGGDIAGEGFLVSFITIAIVLDAALDGAVMLAERDEEGGS